MPPTTPRALALGTVLLATAVPAAAAPGATVTLSQPCQIASFALNADLVGFTPNRPVTVEGQGIFASGTTDATGTASIMFNAPLLGTNDPGSKAFTITAQDSAPAPLTAMATFRSANFAFSTSGGAKSPKAQRAWRFSGLVPGKPIYGHFRHAGKTRGNYRFGVAGSPCGELTVKAPSIAVKGRVSSGRWIVWIDQKRTYSPSTRPRIKGSTTVYKVLRQR